MPYIESILLDLQVTITCLMVLSKKEHASETFRMPLMTRLNFPGIEIPTIDSKFFNWRLFWEHFQATVHNKPHLEEVNKLTYLRCALRDGPATNLIKGLTQQRVELHNTALQSHDLDYTSHQ